MPQGTVWVSALAKYNFRLEYQKGQDNAGADALSRVTTCIPLEAVQAVLDEGDHRHILMSRERNTSYH